MNNRTCLITGAGGLVGSSLAEACVKRGYKVKALIRTGSDGSFLEKLGVEVVRGDLQDKSLPIEATQGVDTVFHCAAKVGDWGSVDSYRQVNVEGLRKLLDSLNPAQLYKFVHFSSLGVYEARHHHQTDESTPPPDQHFDGYTQSKMESEKLALQYHKDKGYPIVVLRPGFIYGPRDRTVLPRLMEKLKTKEVKYIGSSSYAMNNIFVGNLVQAAFLALDNPNAVGQVFNLTDGEKVSKKRFITTIAKGMNLPTPFFLPVPLWLVKLIASSMEKKALKRGALEAPKITKANIKFLGLNLDFSIEKAKRILGYAPAKTFDEGMAETLNWYKNKS
ncbi:MAG: NAD-dependent epimerase/dehydratase family protein [Gemmataceae bacterium]|nr:NAD-dependent epimerase/dehydratase family protein [Gemmataceae bacterium]MBJ7431280.1 NAD-dependent epimerase/dehydratase family protein [Gemmataceae bacterium]